MRYLIILLMLTACSEKYKGTVKEYNSTRQVPIKFCIQVCRAKEFQSFHTHSGEFLGGAASSSMNGLSQQQIYDRVTKECEVFYNGVNCCKGDAEVTWRNIYTNHSYDYGQCKE